METTPRSEYTPEMVAELIAEARTVPEADVSPITQLVHDLVDTLEAAEDMRAMTLMFMRHARAERDEALDVIRSIRLYCENQGDKFRYHAGEILSRIPEHPKED